MIVGLLAVVFTAGGPGAPQADEKPPVHLVRESPVGSWFVYICPGSSDPCSTASPIINIVTINKDGTQVSADYGANPWPSPGLGVWGKTGPNQFAVTFAELLSDAQGTLVGRSKVRGALTYDQTSDTLAGPFQSDITDPSGQNVQDHFEGTVLLTRMRLEPLP
jgi:hypothetical protein